MPTYEYECRDCGHRFERFQRINEEPLTDCPACSGTVRRLISSGGGLVFKGPGFYATDYRRGPGPGSGSGDEPSTGKPAEEGGEGKKKEGSSDPD